MASVCVLVGMCPGWHADTNTPLYNCVSSTREKKRVQGRAFPTDTDALDILRHREWFQVK